MSSISSPDRVRWLFLDLNSYFASVEQQENPSLRGKPVAVVPVNVDSTCCIATSYEAKAFGVRTGIGVSEAKMLCPSLILVEARPHLYVRYHHAIVEAVDTCVPVAEILSIDEMVCQLTGSQETVENAVALAHKIKKTIYQRAGQCLHCSIGLAPNRFLAKVAGEMKKPNGLSVIRPSDLHDILVRLDLTDLPGVGPRMEKRLHKNGIYRMSQLLALDSREMRRLWGGIVGERFWALLKGVEAEGPATRRQSLSHSHVLEPQFRTRTSALQIAQKLTCKVATRLRKMSYWASGMLLSVKFAQHSSYDLQIHLDEIQDTPTFLKALRLLWDKLPPRNPLWVSVTLYALTPAERHTPSFLNDVKREKMSAVVDSINDRFGKNATYFGSLYRVKEKAPTRIGFTRIPELSEMK